MGGEDAGGFEFSVKLFQKLTHPRMFLDRVTKAPPATRPRDAAVRFDGSHATLARRRR